MICQQTGTLLVQVMACCLFSTNSTTWILGYFGMLCCSCCLFQEINDVRLPLFFNPITQKHIFMDLIKRSLKDNSHVNMTHFIGCVLFRLVYFVSNMNWFPCHPFFIFPVYMLCGRIGHIALVDISGVSMLVSYHLVKSLQLIWWWGICRWNSQALDLQITIKSLI